MSTKLDAAYEAYKRAEAEHRAAEDIALSGTLYWETSGIADQVWDERTRQLIKRGMQTRPNGVSAEVWKPLELEAKAEYEATGEGEELTWVHILKEEVYEAFAEEDTEKLKVELVQVMAVAASWLQDLELKQRREEALDRAEFFAA